MIKNCLNNGFRHFVYFQLLCARRYNKQIERLSITAHFIPVLRDLVSDICFGISSQTGSGWKWLLGCFIKRDAAAAADVVVGAGPPGRPLDPWPSRTGR